MLQASDFPTALGLVETHDDVDLALLDVYMPGMDQLTGVKRMTAQFPKDAVLKNVPARRSLCTKHIDRFGVFCG